MSLLQASNHELAFDGERFVPGAGVEISYHHWLRYCFARQVVDGRRVLDVGSGEGYGAAYLATAAAHVDAFDISEAAVAYASATYGKDSSRLSYQCKSIEAFFQTAKPGSYEVVTAFDVIEHVDDRMQLKLLEGIRRVLAPGGIALISTPDKQLYTDVPLTKNPFHVRELYRDEFVELLGKVFPSVRLFEQLTYSGAALFEQGAQRAELIEMSWTDLIRLRAQCKAGISGAGEYMVAVVSTDPSELALQSAVMLDRSKKLISEEVYNKHLEAEALRQHLEATKQEAETIRRDSEIVRGDAEALKREAEVAREAARQESSSTRAALEAQLREVEALRLSERREVEGARESVRTVMSALEGSKKALEAMRLELEASRLTQDELREKLAGQRAALGETTAQLEELRRSWVPPAESERRQRESELVIDRLLKVIVRDAEEVSRGQRAEVERVMLEGHLDCMLREFHIERHAREAIEEMVSLKLIRKAKTVWDRVPVVKNAVKAVARKLV